LIPEPSSHIPLALEDSFLHETLKIA
jgi:hypothetical protein